MHKGPCKILRIAYLELVFYAINSMRVINRLLTSRPSYQIVFIYQKLLIFLYKVAAVHFYLFPVLSADWQLPIL